MTRAAIAFAAIFTPAYAAALIYSLWLGAGGDWSLFQVLCAIGAVLLYVEGNK